MPEAELARVDECDRSIPRRETIRGTHWQKTPFGCLDLASRNPSWQRSCATATTDRTYDRKRSDAHEQTLATRGPSTYGSRPSAGTTSSISALPCRLRRLAAAIARRLIGDPRVMCAIGQAAQRLAAAEEEFRTGGIADRPVAGRLIQFQQRQPLTHRHHIVVGDGIRFQLDFESMGQRGVAPRDRTRNP